MKFKDDNAIMSVKGFQKLFQAEITAEQVLILLRQHYKGFKQECSIKNILSQPDSMIKRYDGLIYVGQIINNIRTGKGVLIYGNGRIYEGQWEQDKKEGYGNELFANQNRYEGHYVNGRPQGKGFYLWANGELYDGQWMQGRKHGSGVWQGLKGDSYMGEWKEGCADGYGVHVWTNGDRYEGQFQGNLKNGQGKEIFKNGDNYVGAYVNGKPDGLGEYCWKNGTLYKGFFQNGSRNGLGVWTKHLNKEQFEQYRGQYKNDLKSGLGTYEWPNGNTYRGEFMNDLRHGIGQMIWQDGSSYVGYWQDGAQQGEGILSIKGQENVHAIFQNSAISVVVVDNVRLKVLSAKVEQILNKIKLQQCKENVEDHEKLLNNLQQHSTTDSSTNRGPMSFKSLNTKLRSDIILKQYNVNHNTPLNKLSPHNYHNKHRFKNLHIQNIVHTEGNQTVSNHDSHLFQTLYGADYIQQKSVQVEGHTAQIPFNYKPINRLKLNRNSHRSVNLSRANQSFYMHIKRGIKFLISIKVNERYTSEQSNDSITVPKSPRATKSFWVPSGQVKRQPDYISS